MDRFKLEIIKNDEELLKDFENRMKLIMDIRNNLLKLKKLKKIIVEKEEKNYSIKSLLNYYQKKNILRQEQYEKIREIKLLKPLKTTNIVKLSVFLKKNPEKKEIEDYIVENFF